jgi:Spy/CpxP family protein refolding chaperone
MKNESTTKPAVCARTLAIEWNGIDERSTTLKQRLLLTLALLGLLVIAYTPAFAQAPDDEENQMEVFISDDMGPGLEDMGPSEDVMIFAGGMGMGPGGGHRMGMGGPGCNLKGMSDELELTKDQRKQMENLQFAFHKAMIPQKAQLQVLNLDLQNMIRNDAKPTEIDAQIDQIGKLRTEIQKQTVKQRLAMKAILTPEQREKLNERPGMCGMGHGKGGVNKEVIIKKLGKGQGKGL